MITGTERQLAALLVDEGLNYKPSAQLHVDGDKSGKWSVSVFVSGVPGFNGYHCWLSSVRSPETFREFATSDAALRSAGKIARLVDPGCSVGRCLISFNAF